MLSSTDTVGCIIQDGAVLMHLDNERVEIPAHIVKKSKILTDALLPEADPSLTKSLTLAAPEEWLKAWAACFCCDGKRVTSADIRDLVNCLMVCFFTRSQLPSF
jgi:hypothetical protein